MNRVYEAVERFRLICGATLRLLRDNDALHGNMRYAQLVGDCSNAEALGVQLAGLIAVYNLARAAQVIGLPCAAQSGDCCQGPFGTANALLLSNGGQDRQNRIAKDPAAIYVNVAFLKDGNIERERILQERYACTAMEDWLAKGTEYKVRNHPVRLPQFGVAASAMRSRHFRVHAAKVFRGLA